MNDDITVYRDEDFQTTILLTRNGSPADGLTLSFSLLDPATGSTVAGPIAATESPAGTYAATIPAAQTKIISTASVLRRFFAPGGGLDARDPIDAALPVGYRPFT